MSCAALPPKRPAALPPERLFDALERDLAMISSYRAWGGLSLKSPSRSLRGRYFIAARSPDSMRFEVVSPLGNTLWAAVLSGGGIRVYDASSEVFYKGKATPESIARFFGVPPMEPWDLYNLLLGRAEPRDLAPFGARGKYLFKGRYVVTFRGAIMGGMRPVQGKAFTLKLGGELEADGILFPGRLTLFYRNGARLESTLRGLELNPGLDDGVFTLEMPKGARFYELHDEKTEAGKP